MILLFRTFRLLLDATSLAVCVLGVLYLSGSPALAASSTIATTSDRVVLNDNHTMPLVGLGMALTFDETHAAVQWALDAGYRLIDTAADETYANQDKIGWALRDWITRQHHEQHDDETQEQDAPAKDTTNREAPIRRSDIFVTTKLWDTEHGFYPAIQAFYQSLHEFNHHYLDNYVDLYLMHSPFGGHLVETWDAMIYLQQRRRLIRSIGVSNFGIRHLQVLENHGRPLPAVNQIELHPLVYQKRLPLIEYCQQHNIQIQAYGSVIMLQFAEWVDLTKLTDIAQRLQKTPAQILLKWALQHGFGIIPKSVKQERIQENIDLDDFVLSEEDMYVLDHWGEEMLLYKDDWNWNPIDEAPVHLGQEFAYWADNFTDVDESYIDEHLLHPPEEDAWDDEEDEDWGEFDKSGYKTEDEL